MNRSNKSTWTEKNRWGLFFINGVGVKLAGWAHVATHWIECLVYLGCVNRLRDDLVYSSEKTLRCSINVTNQPHQQFVWIYRDNCQREGGSELALKKCVTALRTKFQPAFEMVGCDCPLSLPDFPIHVFKRDFKHQSLAHSVFVSFHF